MSDFEKVLDEYKEQTKPMCEALGCIELLDDFLVDIELSRAKYHHFYQAGQQSQQAKIEAITKQRDSFIKAHHIAMNDVCENKAKIAELQARVDEVLDMLKGRKGKVLLDDIVDTLKGNKDGRV